MVNKEAERRVMGAAALLVREHVLASLPSDRRGLRATRYLDQKARSRIEAVLNGVIRELAVEILALPDGSDQLPPITQRLSVLRNDKPCRICQTVRSVAILDIVEGELRGVECEACAPEFMDGSRWKPKPGGTRAENEGSVE